MDTTVKELNETTQELTFSLTKDETIMIDMIKNLTRENEMLKDNIESLQNDLKQEVQRYKDLIDGLNLAQ